MKKIVTTIIILFILNSCKSLGTASNTEKYNVASHDEEILVYSSLNSRIGVLVIPANTNFRVSTLTIKSKKYSRRKIHYDGNDYWAASQSYKNEMDYATWARIENSKTNNVKNITPNEEHQIQTGSRGGKFYINKNGKKVYIK